MSEKIFEPFKTGNVYKMRHGNVWSTFLMSDQLFYSMEHGALDQVRNSMSLPGVKSMTITPDAHTGYGFAIGTVVESETHIYPDVVGPDPACSVSLGKLGFSGLSKESKDTKEKFLGSLEEKIGVGSQTRDYGLTYENFIHIIDGNLRPNAKVWVNKETPIWNLKARKEFFRLMDLFEKIVTPHMLTQVGTIGGGNHFVEIQEDEDGNNYVMSHFGSRGVGAAGAKWFDRAIEEELKKWNGSPINGLLFVPIDSDLGTMYYLFQRAMLEWATYNHYYIYELVLLAAKESGFDVSNHDFVGHIPHNFIEMKDGKYIGRKGATPAYDNDGIPLLVPGSMSTASYILRPGPMAPKFGESVSHGAGRVLSRGKAKENLDQETLNLEFSEAGVIGNFESVPMDESSAAYKDVDEVIQSLVDSEVATIENKLKPIIVLKG